MFKKNSPELKILLINLLIVLGLTVFGILLFLPRLNIRLSILQGIPISLGIAALIVGAVDIFIALVSFAASAKGKGRAFLITGGILLLISGISCGGLASFA